MYSGVKEAGMKKRTSAGHTQVLAGHLRGSSQSPWVLTPSCPRVVTVCGQQGAPKTSAAPHKCVVRLMVKTALTLGHLSVPTFKP